MPNFYWLRKHLSQEFANGNVKFNNKSLQKLIEMRTLPNPEQVKYSFTIESSNEPDCILTANYTNLQKYLKKIL